MPERTKAPLPRNAKAGRGLQEYILHDRTCTRVNGDIRSLIAAYPFSAKDFVGAPIRQVSWLTGGSDSLSFPFRTEQWNCEIIPELQWRDRAGIAPASLLTLWRNKAPGGSYSIVQANALSHYSLLNRKKEVYLSRFFLPLSPRPTATVPTFANFSSAVPSPNRHSANICEPFFRCSLTQPPQCQHLRTFLPLFLTQPPQRQH